MFKKLKNMRKEQNVTIKHMAELLELKSPSSYWKKENGDVSFSLNEAKKLSIFLEKLLMRYFFSLKLSLKETRCNL